MNENELRLRKKAQYNIKVATDYFKSGDESRSRRALRMVRKKDLGRLLEGVRLYGGEKAMMFLVREKLMGN